MQIHDLVKLYETKTDEELTQLAMDAGQLTPEAHGALLGELTRRRIDIASPHSPIGKTLVEKPNRSVPIDSLLNGVSEFVGDVLIVYHRHFWLFVKLIAPAVAIGYIAVLSGRRESREILRHLLGSNEILRHPIVVTEAWLVTFTGFFISWMAFCCAFAAICSAVRGIQSGSILSVRDAFLDALKPAGPFLRVCAVLFFLVLMAFGASGLVSSGLIWLSFRHHIHLRHLTTWIFSYGLACLALLVVSRFALAIPAVILDDYKAGPAIFRSDELTEKKWFILATLLSKSLIGGYVAGMIPYWLASWIPDNVSLPTWFPWLLTAASLSAVVVVEPTMFIGFALLYLKGSAAAASISSDRFLKPQMSQETLK